MYSYYSNNLIIIKNTFENQILKYENNQIPKEIYNKIFDMEIIYG